MKSLLSSLFGLIMFFSSYSQNIDFEDPVFKDYLIFFGVDSNHDDKISIKEAEAIHKLELPYIEDYYPIRDLSGIESFINLDTLSCTWHAIDSVFLNENKNLIFLDLSYNYSLHYLQIDSLSQLQHLNIITQNYYSFDSVDFSHLTNLKELYLDYHKALNVSMNSKLEILHARFTPIEVTNNPRLKRLTCSNIDTIDLSNNSELEYFSCVAYGGPPKEGLKYLDLSNNPRLKQLDCEQNKISNLDFSHNPDLERLNVRTNPVKILDFSNNLKLKHLDCNQCDLDSLNLLNNTELKSLSCSRTNLSFLDLSNNSKLESLHCNTNPRLGTVCVWELPFPPASLIWFSDYDCPIIEYKLCVNNISDDKIPKINIYPNPATDILIMSCEGEVFINEILIFNTSGSLIFQKVNIEVDLEYNIPLDQLRNGLFFIKIYSNKGILSTTFLKQ